MKILRIRPHRSWSELASAFADGSLEPVRRESFERHLDACARCRAAVADLTSLRAALQALPDREVPRSFRLTPAMLAATDPLDTRRPSRAFRVASIGARMTAGVAAAALAAVFVVDFGTSGGGDTDQAAQRTAGGDGSAEIAAATMADHALEANAGASSGGEGPDDAAATSAAGSPAPTAPPFEETEVTGASSGGGETPAALATPLADETTAPDDSASRELFNSTTDDPGTEADSQFATIESTGDDSDRSLLRGLQVGLAAMLVAALGAVFYFRGESRVRG